MNGWMLFALLASTLTLGCTDGGEEKKAGAGAGTMQVSTSITVEAIQPERGEFVVWGDYPGEFVSDGMAELSSEVGGRVTSVEVRLGDVVKKGDTLAVVDPVSYQQRVREVRATVSLSEAGLEEAKVQLENMRRELERKQPLLAQKLVTEREIEDLQARVSAAEQRLEIARATVEQNKARLGSARDTLSDTRIRAPFAGTLAERYVDVGAHVNPGEPMFRLVDDQEIYLRLRVPETESGLVKPGMAVEIRVDAMGGQQILGVVGRVAPAVDPATRTLRVDVVKPEDASGWEAVKPGMYARSRLQLGERDSALTLDNQAILKGRDAARFVWVIADGQAEKRTITTGLKGRQRTEILEGLAEGEHVVLRGMEKLVPGAKVALARRADEAPAAPAAKEEPK